MLACLALTCALRVAPAAMHMSALPDAPPSCLTRRAALAAAAALASGASPAHASLVAAKVTQLDKAAETRNSVGAPEKHLPSLLAEGGGKEAKLTMTVPHVMDPEKPHFIEYMWLKDVGTDAVLAVKALKASDPSPPTLVASVAKGKTVVPMLYCNLHGLWEGKPFAVA
ncbi:hypothetical protein AB1Y20_000351 [Prymnesium parvum]|uniref:Desulfoferrodoxin ferrous iron-binding domain-containing protein n=1 Tax=Prymnesium parvum TaxID=97485 RepID=A0AB34K7P1_PRYPA